MKRADTVDAILMASGASRRFGGQDKLLTPFLGDALVHHTLHLVCGMSHFGRVFLVFSNPQVADAAKGFAVESILNTAPESGQRESICLGVQASSADYYTFFSCDQPLLDAAVVEEVLRYKKKGHIAFPAWQGKPGLPSVFSRTFREALLALGPGQHARDIKKAHPDALIAVSVASPLVLADIDTPEELATLEAQARKLNS